MPCFSCSGPPGDTCPALARDHAARCGVLSRADSLGCRRSLRPCIAWCSRPRSRTASPGGPLMLDHVTIRASDREASRRFYDVVMGTLGFDPVEPAAAYYEWGDFSVAQADGEHPVTRHLHVAFAAPSQE